ncbi:MAG: hypothetical protein DME72_05080 [Verrucomicrobia bacterium]|nr:MAG: hypothetical protein DME72_05080 [Verrucomicrobiota bacterium]
MNWRTTFILAAIVLAVFAYFRFFELKQPSTEEAKRQAQNVVNFERAKIDGVVIQNGDDKIEMRRRDHKWRLETPIKDQADGSLIENLLSDLENWQKDATISAKEIETDKSKLNEYGLSKPKLRLKLLGQDRPPEIFFGKDAALEGRMYVRLGDSKETFLASQTVKKDVEKKPEEFRDRKLTDLSTAQVSRVLLKSPVGEMELEKRNDHWEILKPLRARGEDQKIADLIAQVTTAQIQQFVADDHGDLHPFGLAEPRGAITLFSKDDKQGQLLQIGGIPQKEKDQVYVRSASRGFVYTLPKKIEEVLNTRPDDLRDRHLVRIDTNILDRITIDAPGKGKIVLARKNENWTIASHKNVPANSGEIRRLIDTLQNEQVTKFVEDVASNLPKYGLDKPQLRLIFSSFASENTAETKAGEQPFTTITFGKIDGDNVYARLADEPFVAAIRRGLIDQISTDAVQWQELSIFKFKPEQIHRLSVAAKNESMLARDAKDEWTWTKGGETINQANLQSLLKTLSSLHAVRWVGPTLPQHGFEKPQLAITFTTSLDDKSSHKLLVGSKDGHGTWFARAEEREGTFVISDSDFDTLRLSLATETGSPLAPAASVPASPSPAAAPKSSP